jgi:GNAT superfamily N-acetyltransferase
MAIRDDEFWAQFLGIEPLDWNLPGISIRAHVGLSGYKGLWFFRRRDHTVVSAPAGWVPLLRSCLDENDAASLFDETFIASLFGYDFDGLIGPAFQGCLEPANFRPVPAKEVRPLTPGDSAAYQQLRDQCIPTDVSHSGLHKATDHVGYFQDSSLLAVAGYRAWTDVAGDPCILTHPDFHRRGYGTAVTSTVVQRALAHGKLLLYQTLEANAGAVGIARKLGYEQYARHVAVRLRRDAPSTEHS